MEPTSIIALEQGFRTPPASARPWVMWMWLRVHTTHAAITKDLEEMHAKGIEGAIIYDSGVGGHMEADSRMVLGHKGYKRVKTSDYKDAHFTAIPLPPLETWSPESNELLRFAAGQADRIGIKLMITEGLAETSGKIAPRYGQQQLQWSELSLSGPSAFNGKLPEPLNNIERRSIKPGSQSFISAEHPAKPSLDMHDIAVLAVPDKPTFLSSEVIRLKALPNADGQFEWTVPAGKWKLLRFAYAPTGRTNAWGLFTDGMSDEALDATWSVTLARVLDGMTPAQRRGLYGIEDDSWEAGQSTWTKLFAEQFHQLRGYDLIPWLPAVAGLEIGTAAEREGVQRDFDRTVADLIAKHHYAHLNELARQNKLVLYAEAAGPNSVQLDPLLDSGSVAVPMGEFWMPSQHRDTLDRRFLARDSANGAHVYGKPVIACEALTSVGPLWEENFLDMKITADQAFADGCNRLAIHNYSHSPSLTAYPGYVYFAGTLYSRTTTWWQQTPAFNTYLGRNQFLLQQGKFIADALYLRGGGIGQVEQRKTIPTLPAPGYDHDNSNLDVLLHRVSVKEGRISLPDGMSYRMLVLASDAPLPLDAVRKLQELLAQGAIVVGPRPRAMAGLASSAEQTQAFNSLVTQLWAEGTLPTQAGKVWAVTARDALKVLRLPPDFSFEGLSPDGEIDWIHRRAGTTEIYMVASRWDAPEKITATFRVAGMQPELWNPVTGETREARAFHQADGRTEVPLEFDPRGSVYVLFRHPIPITTAGTAATNYPTITPVNVVSGPWQVSFDPKWGGPKSVTFDSLQDWTQRPEDGIRHYSGTAVYHNTLTLKAPPRQGERLLLDLGVVHEIASVRLNGVDLGVVWTRPARIDITKAAHAGSNQLEITVVNLWPNRLIGDEALPEAQRFTVTNAHKFGASTPLLSSGLLGPVRLEREEMQ